MDTSEIISIVNKNLSETLLDNCPTILTYDEINRSIPYRRAKELYSLKHHNGQLKLFLSEVQFLTNMCDYINEEVFVIYAGSAPGNKNIYLSQLFPNMKFIFVDPEEHFFKLGSKNQYNDENIMNKILYFNISKNPLKFNFKKGLALPHKINYYDQKTDEIKNNNRYGVVLEEDTPDNLSELILKFSEEKKYNIFVIEDFFTSELADKLHLLKQKGKKVFFISDIRTVSDIKTLSRLNTQDLLDDDEYGPKDGDILWNSAQMYNWLLILQPSAYMLKFRCPFSSDSDISEFENNPDILKCKDDIDFIGDYKNKKYKFIKGDNIYLQAYQGKSSTETRLVGREKYNLSKKYFLETKYYSIKDYEDRLFYYNNIVRAFGWHYQIPKIFLNKYYMVDRCGDCAIMSHILIEYVKKKNIVKPLDDETTYAQAFSILETTLKNLERHFLNSDHDLHGFYNKKIYNIEHINLYHDYQYKKFNTLALLRSKKMGYISPQYRVVSDFIYWFKKIKAGNEKSRKTIRDDCMLELLFEIKNKHKQILQKVNFSQRKNIIDVTVDNKTKTYTLRGVNSGFKDLVFSRKFSGLEDIIITDPFFYDQLKKTLNNFNINKIYLLLSNNCDFPFTKYFYEDNKDDIEIYTLIDKGLKKLPNFISRNELLIVYIDEIPHINSYIKNYIIRKYTSSRILFLFPSDNRIYEKYYIFTKGSYIEVETYDGINNLKFRINEEMLSTDSFDIDKNIKFWLKDVPYLFNCKLSEELNYDAINKYAICSRTYILSQKKIDFLALEVLKEDKEIQKIFYIKSLKNNVNCEDVHNYFIFTNNINLDYFNLHRQLKINGEFIFTNKPKNLDELDNLNFMELSNKDLYNKISEEKSQIKIKSSFKNLKEILEDIEY